MKRARFYWKSSCTTCRDARAFLRSQLKAALDERDYAKQPLSAAELREVFASRDPREFLNPRSPAFKQRELEGKKLSADDAIALMAEEPNLMKRPLTIVGDEYIAGFDRERLRRALG